MADGGVQFDPQYYASLPQVAARDNQRSPFTAGGLAGLGDVAANVVGLPIQGAGQYLGLPAVAQFGADITRNTQTAAEASRPDLQTPPWRPNGAPVVPWLEYQVARQVPTLATYMLAGRLTPKALVPQELQKLGATLPRVLGGGGLKAGASVEARRAAIEAGRDFGRSVVGAQLAGLPVAFSSMYQEAQNQPGGATKNDILKAAALSPVYAALDALEPAQLKGLVSRGLEGNLVRRVATAGLVAAAAEVPQEGLQTAMEQSFRSDLSARDKVTNIVDAAVTGGAVGGVFGGVGGIRALKRANPSEISTDNLDQVTSDLLLPPPSGQPAGFAPGQRIDVTPEGVAQPGSDYVRSELDTGAAPVPEVRPMKGSSDEELLTQSRVAQTYLNNLGEKKLGEREALINNYLRLANAELQNRGIEPPVAPAVNNKATNDNISTEAAGAVERTASGGSAATSAAPAPATSTVEDALKGISTRKAYIDAKDVEEVKARLVARLENGSKAKGDLTLADRLGVDLNAPAKVATAEEGTQGQTGAQATVDTDFQHQYQEMLSKRRGSAIADLKANLAPNKEVAQRQIYDAIGNSNYDTRSDGYKGLLEVAKLLGVHNEEGQLTDEGVKIAREKLPLELTVKAAIERGYTATEASAFDRGARGERKVTLNSIAELQAYNEGKDWATNRTAKGGTVGTSAPIPETAPETFTQEVLDKQGKVKNVASSAKIPDVQKQQQVTNAQIDQVYGSLLRPAEQVQLKKMARQGATPQELDQAAAAFPTSQQRRDEARYYQTGHGALANMGPQEHELFKGVTIDRGPIIQARQRAQAAAQEASLQQVDRQTQKQAAKTAVQEHLRYKQQLHDAINGSVENGDITPTQRIKAVHMLVNNDLRGVENLLSNPEEDAKVTASRREFLAGLTASAAALVGSHPVSAENLIRTPASDTLRSFIEHGDVNGALTHIRNTSSNPGYRMIANKLLRGGMSGTRIQVAMDDGIHDGNTHRERDGSSTVSIYEHGMSEETILHELIHAYVQQRWAGLRYYSAATKDLLNDTSDRNDAVVRRWNDLWEKISEAIVAKNPQLTDDNAQLTPNDLILAETAHNPDEMLSYVLTSPEAQAYLRTVDENGNKVTQDKSLWASIVDFFRRLFGLPASGHTMTALDQLLSAGYSVLDAGVGLKTGDLSAKLAQELAQERGEPKLRATAENISSVARDHVQSAINLADTTMARDAAAGTLRKFALPWHSEHHITQFWGKRWFDIKDAIGKVVNGVSDREQAMDYRSAIIQRFAMLRTNAMDAYDRLKATDKKSADAVGELMTASQLGIDPRRTWDNQSDAVKARQELRPEWLKFHNQYRGLVTKGANGVYDNLHYMNDTIMLAHMALALHLDTETDPYMKGKLGTLSSNPIDDFMHAQIAKDFNVEDARKWFHDRLTAQVKGINDQVSNLKNSQSDTSIRKSVRDKFQTPIDEFAERTGKITNAMTQLDHAPYFHLGRFGDYFVTFKTEDVDKLRKAAGELRKQGFKSVINDLSNAVDEGGNYRVYMRVESRSAWKQLSDAVERLKKDNTVHTVLRGQRDADSFPSELTPHRFEKLIANIQNSDLPGDVKNDAITRIRGLSVDMLPETAIGRMLAHREDVPGFSPDMIRAFDFRMMSGINAMAGMSIEPTLTKAFVDMRTAIHKAQADDTDQTSLNQREGMVDVIKELARRDRERAWWPHNKILDQLRAFSSSHFLGFSPSFGLLNLSQMGVTLLPQLGSQYGYSKTMGAMSSSTALAFKIMRQVASQGSKISMSRAMDAVITRDALNAVPGLSKDMADYIMHVVNRGGVDIGGQSREMMRSAEGRGSDVIDGYMRWASAVGYYTETMTRLVAAISTYKLSPKKGEALVDEAMLHITDSMWNYAMSNQGRRFGKRGVIGEYSPLALQFMQYQAQLGEKLIRETFNSFAGTPEEKAIGRKYLKGHLAAMTVLAGTLGLPLVTVLAGLFDRLKDLWDDDEQPSDVRAAYRNWLASVVGKDPAELISHGLFRQAGLDISQRAGEQDLFPFSKFLTDRRQFKDSLKDLMAQSWGAPSSMIANWLKGGEKISNGDVVDGAAMLLPNYLAGPVKAGKLLNDGYVDAEGKKIPVSDNARAVMVQLLGFNPSEKAEYNEAKNQLGVRGGVTARRATVLRDQLAKAIINGDDAHAQELIKETQAFDRANPTFAVLPNMREVISRRAKAEAYARATQTPLGIDPRDLQAQQLTAYANY